MATSDICSGSKEAIMDKARTNYKMDGDTKNNGCSSKPKKPKSPKVLVRKNTPAELPTISKIYGKLNDFKIQLIDTLII